MILEESEFYRLSGHIDMRKPRGTGMLCEINHVASHFPHNCHKNQQLVVAGTLMGAARWSGMRRGRPIMTRSS